MSTVYEQVRQWATDHPQMVLAGGAAVAGLWAIKRLVFKPESFSWKDKVVIITGASDGIAMECALQLASQGALMTLVARRAGKLAEVAAECNRIAGRECTLVVPADIAVEANCKKVVEETIQNYGRLDVLLSVAGISMAARFEDLKDEGNDVLNQLMNTNFWGPVNLTKYSLPHLIKSKGRIGVVASGGAVLPFATRTGYCSSKHAVLGFMDALRWEIEPRHGIHISTVVLNLVAGTRMNETRVGVDGKPTALGGFDPKVGMNKKHAAKTILQGVASKRRDITLDLRPWIVLRMFFPHTIEKLINVAADGLMRHEFPLYGK